MNRKHILIWGLYDFANSFVFITFLLYFSKWLVVNKGLSDFWYNALFVIGSLGLVIFAPTLGIRADHFNRSRRYLIMSTMACGLFYGLSIVTAIAGSPIYLPAALFGLGNFFYQLSFVFYTPLLNNIAPAEKHGKVSGIGFFWNYAGQICALLIAIPLVSGKISLGVDPLIAALIPATIIFIICALPLLLNKDIFKKKTLGGSVDTNSAAMPSQWTLLKIIVRKPGVLHFLIAFFLFSDAITTIINNFSIYSNSVIAVSDKVVSILVLSVIVFAAFGAWLWGALADKFGAQKMLSVILVAWVFVIAGLSLSKTFISFGVFTVFAGIFIGGTWSVSRSLLISLVPSNMINYAFGLYGISERAATFVGPLVWTLVLSLSNYRMAMFSMVFFQIASVVLIFFLKQNPHDPSTIKPLFYKKSMNNV